MLDKISSVDVIASLRAIKPGQQVVYHSGHLGADREREGTSGGMVHKVAEEAWQLSKRGALFLTQRRVDGGFEYIATGAKQIGVTEEQWNAIPGAK